MEMTRFFINVEELVSFIWESRDKKGVVTIPMSSFRIANIVAEFLIRYGNKDTEVNIIGLRPGERLHEFRDRETSSEHCLNENLTYIFK